MSASASGQRAARRDEIVLGTDLKSRKSPLSEIRCINSRHAGCCADLPEVSVNLRQMEVFRAVISCGGIAGAAALLHVSQPTVSKSLALAERQAGVQLFDRVKGRLIPTVEAKRLFAEIERLWGGVQRVRRLADELAHPTSGVLHVAASSSLGSLLVPLALAQVYADMPDLRASVDLYAPGELVTALLDPYPDVGLSMFPVAHPNLICVASYECGWVCVMPKDHPLEARALIRHEDLHPHRVISLASLAQYGATPSALGGRDDWAPALEVGSGQGACLFVTAGVGLAVIDEVSFAQSAFPQLVARPLHTNARITLQVLRSDSKPQSKAIQAFCAAIDAVLPPKIRDTRRVEIHSER